MSQIEFIWDEQKAETNIAKHGVSFEEAKTAFYDPNARVTYDPDHSQDEDRYILLGISESLRILVVCHLYRKDEETIRLISARKATKPERKQYQGFSP
ncbi:MAG: BrnT family toxin [Cyanobacteria bacterium P01_D01_bin.56]